MNFNDVNKVKRLASKLGITLRSVDLNTRVDGDIQFTYGDGVKPRYYPNAETGFDREVERLNNFLRAAETIG